MKMRKTILYNIILTLAVPALISMPAGAQDSRQRTVLTIVQDALAQLPVQNAADLDKEMADIAASAPESVEILAGMLSPAGQGQNSPVEYALNGIVNYAGSPENAGCAASVKEGLASGIRNNGDVTARSFLLTLLGRIATEEDIPVFVSYADDAQLGSVVVGALSGIPGSGDAIVELMKTDGASRPLLAYAAARMGLAGAEPYLTAWIEELGSDAVKDSDPSSAADTPDMRSYLNALAQCGTSASLKLLEKTSVYDYVTLLGRVAGLGDVKTAAAGARRLLKSDDTNIRCAALEILVSAQDEGAQKYILDAVRKGDREYRCAALRYATGLAGSSAAFMDGIRRLFPSLSDEAMTDVVNWAGDNCISGLADEVVRCIPAARVPDKIEPSASLAVAAIRAAGKLGGDSAADALVAQLAGDADYARVAYGALLSFDGDIRERLAGVLENGGNALQHALGIAGTRRMAALSPEVFALLGSDDGMVRKAAYQALKGVVTPDDCSRLGELLEAADSEFKISALQDALCNALSSLPSGAQYEKVMSLIGAGARPSLYYPALAQAGNRESVDYLSSAYSSGEYADEAFSALMSVDGMDAADVLMSIAGEGQGRSSAALTRVVDLVAASGLDDMSKVSKYSEVLKRTSDPDVRNKVLAALCSTPVMPAFLIASRYLDDSGTAYNAAAAVKTIAAKTTDEIDYHALKSALEKAIAIYSAAGGADDGYAVDEIRKMLAGLQPPSVRFVLPEDEAKAGYEVLFDGTDLSKWTGDMDGYTPVNGTIFVTAGYGDSRNLYTKKEYSDFILRFDFCFVRPGVNNGVGIRTPMGKDAAYWGMCEVQILDHDDPIYKGLHEYQVHGSAYGIIPAKRVVHKPLGEWNSEEIKVVGDRVTVTLNGEVILDGDLREACQGHNVAPDGSGYNPYTTDHRNHPGMFNEKGHVGFLGHGAGIKFRNVRILDLSE